MEASQVTQRLPLSATARWVLSSAAFGGLAIVVHTWPLAARLSTHLPGTHLGDNVVAVWNAWWMKQALASSATQFFYTPMLFAPIGLPLAQQNHMALDALLSATALGGMGLVAAVNVLVIVCIALNGISAWSMAFRYTRSTSAAMLAGVLFALSPVLSIRLLGHFNFLWAWLPVTAIGMWLKAQEVESRAMAVWPAWLWDLQRGSTTTCSPTVWSRLSRYV